MIRAAERICDANLLWRWADTPYVLRLPEPLRRAGTAVDVSATLARKLDACAAYRTQLGFQFGGEPPMRRALADLAGDPPSEHFVVGRPA